MLSDAAAVALYHVENGVRSFAAFTKQMVSEFGDSIKPHLKKLYEDALVAQAGRPATDAPGGDSGSGTPEMSAGASQFLQIARGIAEGRDPGRVRGLANPAVDPKTRAAINVIDEVRGDPAPQTHGEWETAAAALLEQDYEGTKRRALDERGATNDPVLTIAAKKIVEREGMEALEAGDTDALSQFVLLQAKYRQTGTDTARALNARFDASTSVEDRNKRAVLQSVFMPSEKGRKRMDAAKTDGQKKRAADAEAKEIAKIRKVLIKMGVDIANLTPEQLRDPRLMAQTVRVAQGVKSGFGDMAYEYWINSILSAPTTQAANIIGNSINAGWDMTAQRLAEIVVNTVAKDPTSAQAGELRWLYKGITPQVINDAWRRAQLAFSTEAPVFAEEMGYIGGRTKLTDESAVAAGEAMIPGGNRDKAIPGRVGRAVRLPGRMLVAADEFFKSILWNMEVGAQAYRIGKSEGLKGEALSRRIAELAADPQSEASTRAYDKALELTFQEELGDWGDVLISARKKIPGLRYIMPFVTTVANIMKKGIRMSPLGLGNMAFRGARHGFYSLGLSDNANLVYTRRRVVRDAAEQIIGSMVAMGVLSMVLEQDDDNPWITGTGEKFGGSFPKRDLEFRTAPPESIRLGDTWYSYARIEPFATQLAIIVNAANAVKQAKNGREMEDALIELGDKSFDVAWDKSFLQGVGDLMKVKDNPVKGVPRWISNFGSSWSPNILRSSLRATDGSFRDNAIRTDGFGAFLRETSKRTRQKALPHPSLGQPVKVDVWGRPVRKFGEDRALSDVLYRMTVPIRRQDATKVSPVDQMYLNWNANNPNDLLAPSIPQSSFTRNGRKYVFNNAQYTDYMKRAGSAAHDEIASRAKSEDWNLSNPEGWQMEQAKKILDRHRRNVKSEMVREMEPVN